MSRLGLCTPMDDEPLSHGYTNLCDDMDEINMFNFNFYLRRARSILKKINLTSAVKANSNNNTIQNKHSFLSFYPANSPWGTKTMIRV